MDILSKKKKQTNKIYRNVTMISDALFITLYLSKLFDDRVVKGEIYYCKTN